MPGRKVLVEKMVSGPANLVTPNPYIPSKAPGESSEPWDGLGMNIDIWL